MVANDVQLHTVFAVLEYMYLLFVPEMRLISKKKSMPMDWYYLLIFNGVGLLFWQIQNRL